MVPSQTIICKFGTSTLTKGTKSLSKRVMLEFSRQIALLHEQGHRIVVVTSGAQAAGRERLKHPKPNRSVPFKQMMASVGQSELMHIWSAMFAIYDIPVGQVLLTRGDLSNRSRYLNARDTLLSLLQYRVIPIINENDAVATEEIKVGDNDNLSALVASLVAADKLILLTDQKGLYSEDPRKNPQASLISVVEKVDDSIFALAGGSSTGLGTGGMITKLQAAKFASQCGTKTIIASSDEQDVLWKIAQGQPLGTLFLSESSPRESRKRWLLTEKPQGTLLVDKGAETSVLGEGRSLLAVGIKEVKGSFERGAIVEIYSHGGKRIAVGIANYSSIEITSLLGVQSEHIEEVLGFTNGDAIVHRDDMAVLQH
jgi:glutamate 5-kinase